MFAHLNKITSGQETTSRQKREKFLLKRMMSDFPQSGVQLGERNALNISLPNDNIHPPEKKLTTAIFLRCQIEFLRRCFIVTSILVKGDIHEIANSVKSLFSFLSMRWVIKSVSARNFLSGWFSFSKCVKIFHSKLDSISNPLPLHEVKSNEG